MAISEAEIIEACKNQNRRAQEELYRKYYKRLLGICMRYAKTDLEAEDMLQDVFIKVFRYIGNYQPTGSFEGWLKRITVNVSIEHYRKNKKHLFVEDVLSLGDSGYEPGIIEQLSAKEIINLLQYLPDGYRMVFNLFAIEGYSHKEIGEILGVTEGTSKSQYSRARNFLIDLLKKNHNVNTEHYVKF